tara:strand:- start:310 stop:534 length:225 start_codon:yes stop_codon:yes gene_type:complete
LIDLKVIKIKTNEMIKYNSPGSLKESKIDLSSNRLIIPKTSTTIMNLNMFNWKFGYLNKRILIKNNIDNISEKK